MSRRGGNVRVVHTRAQPSASASMRGGRGDRADSYGRGDLGASLVLIFPLLLAYELGVLVSARVNGADFISRALYVIAGGRTGYLLFHAALAAGFLIWIRRTQRWASLRLDVAVPVVLEAAIYALTLGTVVSLIVDHVLGLQLGLPSVVGALGAGVHEELVFRLGMLAGLVALLTAVGFGRRAGIAIAIVASSLLFAGAHHLGAYGEPWSTRAFAFRALAGVIFALIFWFRSLAHAVYAHVLYDLVVAAAS